MALEEASAEINKLPTQPQCLASTASRLCYSRTSWLSRLGIGKMDREVNDLALTVHVATLYGQLPGE